MKCKLILHLKSAEENQRCFGLVCHFMKLRTVGGLSKLKILDPEQPQKWNTITDPHQMDQELLQYCQDHFGKSFGTPYMVAPLSKLLAYDRLAEFGQHVLHGTADLSSQKIDDYTASLLRHQQYCTPANIPKFQEMPYDNLMQGFRKWKECTSTSPSGHHLGIYKALLKDDNRDKKKKEHKNTKTGELNLPQQIRPTQLHLMHPTDRMLCRWYINS